MDAQTARELASRFVSGDRLTPAEEQRLLQWLENHPEARGELLDDEAMDSLLGCLTRLDETAEDFVQDALASRGRMASGRRPLPQAAVPARSVAARAGVPKRPRNALWVGKLAARSAVSRWVAAIACSIAVLLLAAIGWRWLARGSRAATRQTGQRSRRSLPPSRPRPKSRIRGSQPDRAFATLIQSADAAWDTPRGRGRSAVGGRPETGPRQRGTSFRQRDRCLPDRAGGAGTSQSRTKYRCNAAASMPESRAGRRFYRGDPPFPRRRPGHRVRRGRARVRGHRDACPRRAGVAPAAKGPRAAGETHRVGGRGPRSCDDLGPRHRRPGAAGHDRGRRRRRAVPGHGQPRREDGGVPLAPGVRGLPGPRLAAVANRPPASSVSSGPPWSRHPPGRRGLREDRPETRQEPRQPKDPGRHAGTDVSSGEQRAAPAPAPRRAPGSSRSTRTERTISISDSKESGITVTITETVNGKKKTTQVYAATAAELAGKNPYAHRLYRQYLHPRPKTGKTKKE